MKLDISANLGSSGLTRDTAPLFSGEWYFFRLYGNFFVVGAPVGRFAHTRIWSARTTSRSALFQIGIVF